MATDRIEWVDVAKGIGILLVIAGHSFQLSWSAPIYAFHMPLFFFLSGLFVRSAYDLSFYSYAKKVAKRLLVPWGVMLLISLFVCLIVPAWRTQLTVGGLIRDLYSANTNTFQNSSLWFLPCLFFALLMVRGAKTIAESSIILKDVFLALISVSLLFILPQMKAFPLPGGRVPFKIDTAMLAFVFIASAAWWREGVTALIRRFSRPAVFFPLSLLVIFLAWCNGWSNMNSLDFGKHKILYFPIAFLGVFMVSFISDFIARNNQLAWLKDFLTFYGKNSLLIFGFQSLFLRMYILSSNKIFGLNMRLYGGNPVLHQIMSFILLTFVTSPMVVFLWTRIIKERLISK